MVMSYDLAVWEGERPSDDEIALQVFEDLAERSEEDHSPPSPRIRAYVNALVKRWPEDEEGPWSVSPVIEDAAGRGPRGLVR